MSTGSGYDSTGRAIRDLAGVVAPTTRAVSGKGLDGKAETWQVQERNVWEGSRCKVEGLKGEENIALRGL